MPARLRRLRAMRGQSGLPRASRALGVAHWPAAAGERGTAGKDGARARLASLRFKQPVDLRVPKTLDFAAFFDSMTLRGVSGAPSARRSYTLTGLRLARGRQPLALNDKACWLGASDCAWATAGGVHCHLDGEKDVPLRVEPIPDDAGESERDAFCLLMAPRTA